LSDLPQPGAAAGPTDVALSEGKPSRRRGPRLPLEFAVLVRYQNQNGETVRCNCRTLSVSVNGALIALPAPVTVGQTLLLTNVKTSQEIECTARSLKQEENANHVAIEFASWSPEFWEITFPREADDPPAKADTANVRPTKPVFGHVGPMPAPPGSKVDSRTLLIQWTKGHKKILIGLIPLLLALVLWIALQIP
jgi:hypothetical protein